MKMSRQMTNKQVAELLEAVVAALEVKNEDSFRIQAYQKAAISIEHASIDLKDLWKKGQLTQLASIGQGIASYLDELFRTGKVKHFQSLFKGLPPAMFELLPLDGIGPRVAFKLCQSLGISKAHNAIKRLKEAAQDGEIRVLAGFGEESEKDILRAIKEFKQVKTKRILLNKASKLAEEIRVYLEQIPQVAKVEALGSLRRQQATIGDLDLAVATNKPKLVIEHWLKFKAIKQVLAQGNKKVSVILFSGLQVDLRLQAQASFGSLLQYFTGSKAHNIHLRQLAQDKSLSLSEYGIKKGSKLIKFAQEREFYQYLGLDWIPPVLREDRGEIEAAQAHKLPQLIQLEDVKGDLHIHSNFEIETSHDLGQSSLEEIINQAQKLNYEYLAFSDHSPSTSNHSSQQIIDLLKRRKEFFEQQLSSRENSYEKRIIKVFISLEIDILPDGKLTIPDQAFDYLDFAYVSVHSSFRQPKRKMTERVLQALKAHPKVKFLGHPTGRILNQRLGFKLDWDKIFDCCRQNQKFLEINAFPDRLDLADDLIKLAIEQKVGLVLGSDSHAVESMINMKYGVSQAQRGWAEPKHILNTSNLADFKTKLGL